MTNRQIAFRWALLILSGIACLLVFVPFTVEILSAVFFAFALFPLTRSLSSTKYFHHRSWVAITLFGFIMAVTAPVVLVGFSFFRLFSEVSSGGFQKSDLYQDLAHGKDFVFHTLQTLNNRLGLSNQFDVSEFGNNLIENTGAKIMELSTAIVARLPDYVLSLFIFCCALYLFLAEARKIRFLLSHNRLIPSHEMNRLIPILQRSCYVTLVASLAVAVVQASIVAIGSLILGSHNVLLVFLITFIFSFIPVIGAAPVAFFLAILQLIKGQTAFAAGYVIVGILAGTTDNIIRPYLVRGEENIHPVVMLLAILGAIVLFGIPGIFLGPMFVTSAVEIYSLYVFKEPDDSESETVLITT